ncbi:MAG: alpha/beta fold hydrolase [Planctomycetota bacterium]
MDDDFFLTNLELRESTETGEQASGLTHSSMKGMVLLSVLELAARGEPRGAVTVLHDAGDTGSRYREVAQHLAQAGWAVALPDLRGHGRTEGEKGHSNGLREVVRDVEEIQNHLSYRLPDEPKVLIGQGLGANYAVAYALDRPGSLAALVLVAPLFEVPFQEPVKPGGLKGMFKKVTGQSLGSTGYRGQDLSTDASVQQAWDRGQDGVGQAFSLRAIQEARRSQAMLNQLAQTGLPVLVLAGEQDPFVPAERCRGLAGGAVEVEVFPGMRHHLLQGTGSAAVQARIGTFLDAHLGARP